MSETVTTGTGTPGVQERAGEAAGAARQGASQVAGTAKEQAAAIAADAKDQARAVAHDAKSQARQLVDDGRRQLRDQAAEQSHRAASSLRGLSDQLHRMASGEGGAEGPAVDIAHQAASSIQRLADTLEQRRPEELLEDVKRFARQRPGMFVLGALGAGFVAGRVLRAADTSAITEAAKSGAGMGQSGPEQVSGPGSLGSLQAGGATGGLAGEPLTADPLATAPLAAPMTTGIGGTAPADLTDPATPTASPRWSDEPGSER